jgi:hypothetical protein
MNFGEMTTSEVERLIFQGARVDEPRAMPLAVALEVIDHDHFSTSLRDWAWETIRLAEENGEI